MQRVFRSQRAVGPVVSIAVAWVLVNLVLGVAGTVWAVPAFSLWPGSVGGAATGALACVFAAVTGGAGPVRDFWRRLAIGAGFMAAGTASWAVDAATATGLQVRMTPLTGGLFLAATGTAVFALLRLPSRRRTRRATVALCLEIAVVSVMAALLGSQFLSSTWIPGRGPLVTALYLIVLGTAGATVVAVIKVGMTGIEPVHPPALWLLAPIGLLSTVTFLLGPLLFRWPHLNGVVIALPLAGMFFAFAARSQIRVNFAPPGPARQPLPTDRPSRFGVWPRTIVSVPYLSVAITIGVLITATLRTGYLKVDLAAGSLVLIILVVVRQLFAIADNTELADRLADRANHDELTGLPNRRFFTAALNGRIAGTTVAVCDLDGFASLNDRLGDDYGDVILREAAARLQLTVGGGAVVARLLGDEFGVLLPHDHSLANGSRLADVLLHAFRAPLHVDDRDLLVTATVGVASADGPDVPDLLRRAELGLQAARVAGGNRHQWYSPELDATAEHHSKIAAALRLSLDRGEFRLLYQPIVELPGGNIRGVEALVRWHPDGGPAISPTDFIPVAEHTGLIVDLGAWIIETACADAAVWHRKHGADAPWISVNVSARQLLDPELPATVAGALRRNGLRPGSLTLEITETSVFAGGAAMSTVQSLRDLGTGIALDDFGTGHSSLTLLRTCPVTTLKVDKSFIDGLNGTAQQEAIATSLSGIAHTLELRAVAEGVESEEQALRLHELGYRHAQGFHFARPVPPEQIDELLTAVRDGDISAVAS